MSREVRIPTILGLGVLIAGLAGGVFLVTATQIFNTRAKEQNTPTQISVANISSNHASIYWQTSQPAAGFVQAGSSYDLGLTFQDERDSKAPQPHKLHFVTLANLSPNTTYYYKISSGSNFFPAEQALVFKTGAAATAATTPPVIGTVLDTTLQPVNEALITLEIPGTLKLAAITKLAGNFILPLTEIYSQTEGKQLNIEEITTPVTLTVSDGEKSSQVTLNLPPGSSPLPPVTIGQNLDLTQKVASPSPTPYNPTYDLNSDGVINSLDLAVIIKNFGKNPGDKRADLNRDGVVDQKDIDMISQYIPHVIPQ